jgi:hypothetical protein
MKKYIFASVLIMTLLIGVESYAQGNHYRHYTYREVYRPNYYPSHSNYYYPSYYRPRTSISVIASLPFGAVALSYGNRYYHYYDGIYYSPYDYGYAIVEPPVGIIVPSLPMGSVSVMIGARPYFRFGSVFYLPLANHQYEVVQKPAEKEEQNTEVTKSVAPKELAGSYDKIVLEGKTYYKQGDKYFKAFVDDNGEISYKEVGTLGK